MVRSATVLTCCAFLLGGVPAAFAQPASETLEPAQPVGPVPEPLCFPDDRGLEELSGLIVVDGTVYAIPDGGSEVAVAEMAGVLDGDCTVTQWIRDTLNPFDPEDLSAHDGKLWIADVGDNRRLRQTVALISLDPETGSTALHRLEFQDNRPRDSETLLIDRFGMPIIVSKWFGLGEVFTPVGRKNVDALASPGPTALEHHGDVAFPITGTPGGPIEVVGSTLATGGAVNSDGTIAAIRTYTDVYFYANADGDLLRALNSEPVRIPIPNEPQGEAIAFTESGDLLTASELGFAITGDPNRPPDGDEPLPPINIIRDVESFVWNTLQERGHSVPERLLPPASSGGGIGGSGETSASATEENDGLLSDRMFIAAAISTGIVLAIVLAGATTVLWKRFRR
ncbi:hypothetical protein [Hoyosella rhizosphaerae]|nr:hypothetical protein [Hoyosella rhizosphaerae]